MPLPLLMTLDHSCNHTALKEDALNANVLLMGDTTTAKLPPAPSRSGWYWGVETVDGVEVKTKIEQDMNVEGGKTRKGMTTILKERKLWKKGLVADCKCCKEEKSRGFKGQADLARRKCCARRIIALEHDFLEQKSEIEEVYPSFYSTPFLSLFRCRALSLFLCKSHALTLARLHTHS
jgi:hypothetical protein